jgi:hypothetical protein
LDCRHPREADLVDRDRGHSHRYVGLACCLASSDLALTGLDHVAHDDLVNLITGQAGTLQGGGEGVTAQVHGGKRGESSIEAPYWSAHGGADDRLIHGFS